MRDSLQVHGRGLVTMNLVSPWPPQADRSVRLQHQEQFNPSLTYSSSSVSHRLTSCLPIPP